MHCLFTGHGDGGGGGRFSYSSSFWGFCVLGLFVCLVGWLVGFFLSLFFDAGVSSR